MAADQRGPLQVETGSNGRIFVLLQLAGGNDGLNTLVPFDNDHYHRARPSLRLKKSQLIELNPEFALHNALSGFKELYDAGNLSIIHGVGYPNPNRSHFRSTEIWHTACDANKVEKYGWLGRYFDHSCKGSDPTVGINIGRQTPQVFAAKNPLGISLDNPENYKIRKNHQGAGEKVMSMNGEMLSDDNDSPEGETISAIGGSSKSGLAPLDFLERTTLDAQVSSEKILAVTRKTRVEGNYPNSSLGRSMKLAAQLIGGNLPTRVYYLSQGGYDTHTNQPGAHQRLLSDLSGSIQAFVQDMKAQKNFERVVLMTFSEFGRRTAENANTGTDHGAAAPLFILGSKVKGGFLGKPPGLAPADLTPGGDLKYGVDFRSVYAGILDRWLEVPSAPILGRKFEPLNFI